ncbi:MAG: DUF2207 domain-containing protein [Sphingomonadales bacterium]
MRWLLALLLLMPAVTQAQDQARMAEAVTLSRGEERILDFVSDVTIGRDGMLDVTETIRLVSLNQSINRGIQRDFPTSYNNGLGQRTSVGFEVVSVQRDGHDEPWERITISNGVRVRIGQADVLLPIGVHTYVIRYRSSRQIHYGEKSDELYWNATGTGWTFPIDVAEARITLPGAAKFGARAVYTGEQGATDHNAEVVEERPGFIAFRTTAPLGREQGLTVAASFPKGVLDTPDSGQKAGWWLQDWGAISAAFAALAGLIAYYFHAWAKVGRGPRAGPVVPIFAPPDDLTPAAARYIWKMKFDNEAFSAAIVYLGVRGQVHIDQEKGGWFTSGTTTLNRTHGDADNQSIARAEAAMLSGLFASGESLELKQENHSTFQAARKALEDGLERDYSDTMFRKNSGWSAGGLLAIAIAILVLSMIAIIFDPTSGPMIQLGIPLTAIAMIAFAWWLRGVAMKTKGCMSFAIWAAVVVIGGIAAMCALGTVTAALAGGAFVVLLPLVMLPVALTAFRWMYAPTKEGRAVMDRIAGFRQYLGITEEERLEALHPPEKTPELFERYLPYAIALDVENRWADRFASVLATAAAAGAATHTMGWYSGSSNFWDNPGGFAETVGSSLASTVSSAATSPSSSSGSSGGGSSGGGGGGGGGSGW